MKILSFEVRFQELRINGEIFDNLIKTETEFNFGLNRNPEDQEETFVGVSAFTKWDFQSGSSAIMQCVCGAFPKAFLITEMSFEEYITLVEAAIGEINLKLPEYLENTPLPNTLEIENLNKQFDKEKMKELFENFKDHDGSTPISTFNEEK